jgi:hypothetical protein
LDFGPFEKHCPIPYPGRFAPFPTFSPGGLWWKDLVGVGMDLGRGFELLILWLFPRVISPLFNKFEPIENK